MTEDEDPEEAQRESSGGAGAHPHRPAEEREGDPQVGELHDDAARALREDAGDGDSMRGR